MEGAGEPLAGKGAYNDNTECDRSTHSPSICSSVSVLAGGTDGQMISLCGIIMQMCLEQTPADCVELVIVARYRR